MDDDVALTGHLTRPDTVTGWLAQPVALTGRLARCVTVTGPLTYGQPVACGGWMPRRAHL